MDGQPPVAAVDIGGTKTLIEVFAADSTGPLGSVESRTARSGDIAATIAESIRHVAGGREIRAAGVASPGPLDPVEGVVLNPPNLSREWWGLRLTDELSRELVAPVWLENDGNLGALGEWAYGAGAGYGSVLYVTVSTGVGTGLVTDGEIFGGNRGFAVELGHTVIDPSGPVCGCGRSGCVEVLASGTAIARRASRMGWTPSSGEPDARAVAAAAEEGDRVARVALEEAAAYLGKALVNFIYSFDPEAVVIGGGVSRSALFMQLVEDAVAREPMMEAFRGVPVLTAALTGRSVIHGARALAEKAAGYDPRG